MRHHQSETDSPQFRNELRLSRKLYCLLDECNYYADEAATSTPPIKFISMARKLLIGFDAASMDRILEIMSQDKGTII